MEANLKTPSKAAVMPKHGQGLRALVQDRARELELELKEIQRGEPGSRDDVEAALAALRGLLTGNLDQIPPVVAEELSQWLETSKHLGIAEEPGRPAPRPVHVKAAPVAKPLVLPSLRSRVEARQRQLEEALAAIKSGGVGEAADIEASLSALKGLLTGNLELIPSVVGRELIQWMETSRYLGTRAVRVRPA